MSAKVEWQFSEKHSTFLIAFDKFWSVFYGLESMWNCLWSGMGLWFKHIYSVRSKTYANWICLVGFKNNQEFNAYKMAIQELRWTLKSIAFALSFQRMRWIIRCCVLMPNEQKCHVGIDRTLAHSMHASLWQMLL